MINQGQSSDNRQANNKLQTDDDNCSVICYKNPTDGHVSVVRIRQQPICSACNSMRGTLSVYYKHIVDNKHRENVKKFCDENRFIPSVYDQAIHLAFHNNFYYQSEKFHFLYKHINEDSDSSSRQLQLSGTDKMEINNNNQQKSNLHKRRNIQVTLVFQEKSYSQIGTDISQIREELFKEMCRDRADDIAALPMEIYYTKKKFAPDDIHHNAQKASAILTMAKDQPEVMLKQQQEPFENGRLSSAETSREDNGVEQNTAMTTQEISTTEIIDVNEQSSVADDVVCKVVLNQILRDIYSQCDEFKREKEFLDGIARRNFKKRNTFICDICDIFLTSEKYCIQHLNESEHLDKVHHYETKFLPWRQAMQKSLIVGKPIKEIMGNNVYDTYKATMALYLAPNNLANRGRFCCAYCEVIFPDQWALEKHLHSVEHKAKQTSSDHKELVVRFANTVNLPIIFKFNGITQLSEIPDDIKNRYHWRSATRAQLDEDISSFIRNYPFDTLEGATRILNVRATKKQKSFAATRATQNLRNNNNIVPRNQQVRRSGFNHTRGGQFPTPIAHRGTAVKRSFPVTAPPTKRFRPDLNNSFPGVNRSSRPMRNYEMNQYDYGQPVPYNNGNNRWPALYSVDQHQQQQQRQQQRQEFFERSNFELRSLASNNNEYYSGRPTQHMSGGNHYNHDRQAHFTDSGSRGYDNQQSNYDPNFIRAAPQVVAEYHPEQNPNSFGGPPNRAHYRTNTGPTNELIHHNNFPRTQQQQQPLPLPPMPQVQHQNQNSFSAFGVNNGNHTNSPFFSTPGNQQPNPMGANGPSVPSYADYRASSVLPANNPSSSIYPLLPNTQNPIVPSQPRTFDEFGLSSLAHGPSNPYGRSTGPSFGNEKPRYGNIPHQNQMEQSPQTSWRRPSRGGNPTRGRGGGHFQSMNKQPGSTFSYSSNNNTSSMRGRGAGRNARNFGSRR